MNTSQNSYVIYLFCIKDNKRKILKLGKDILGLSLIFLCLWHEPDNQTKEISFKMIDY